MNLTYTIAGIVMFLIGLGIAMWAYSTSNNCGSFFGMLAQVISSNQQQQCQNANIGLPIGVLFIIIGLILGVIGAARHDEEIEFERQ